GLPGWGGFRGGLGRRRQVLVEQAGVGRRTAARARVHDLQDTNPTVEGDGEHVVDLHRLAGAVAFLAVDTDATRQGELLRERAGLGHAGEPEPLVDTLTASRRLRPAVGWHAAALLRFLALK